MSAASPRCAEATSARPRGLRIGIVLLLVAVVPLVGLGFATWGAIEEANEVEAAAARTSTIADDAVELIAVDGAVFDEMVWAAIGQVAGELNAPPALLTAFLGSDTDVELTAAQQRTDELVVAAGREDIASALVEARSEGLDLAGILATYRGIMATIDASLSSAITDLSASTSGRAETDDLLRSARLLTHAIDARGAIADEFYGYFATLFELRDSPRIELARLIQSRSVWDASIDALAAAAPQNPSVESGLERVRSDDAVAALNAAIDALITDSLADGIPEAGVPLSLDVVMQNLDGFTSVYQAAGESSATTAELLDATATGMLTAADAVKADADRNIERAYLVAVLLTFATLATALVAARFIVRPLRTLERAARDLQDATDATVAQVGGPKEVRAAGTALLDAAVHLDLVTRQVRALAVGTLDADVLDRSAPGQLGGAVQDAVGTLRAALARQDEFRRRLAHEASHDGLTQLPNRNASMAQLARSLARTGRAGQQLAVLFIDLDRFKDVNDQHGHQAGDTVLTTVAQRLVNEVREGDHVGRLGGDEFVVVAEPVGTPDEAVELGRRLLDRLADPIDIGTTTIVVGASIGIALTDGTDLTADELLRDADLAVYRAKDQGRGGLEVCDEDLRTEMTEAADLSQALRHAIANDELILHYQPIVDTRTNALHAFEALVRWQRPGHDGLVPPDQFIGFAERSNLIIDLDRWVVAAVARQLTDWHHDGSFDGVPIAINISPRHLSHDQFVDHILQPLHDRAINPRSIIIEVTENALLDDLAGAALKLQSLRDAGVLVSIDDFGTGYTSLAHLRSLPVDILKIDRSFTSNAARDTHEASIVKLIIDTGHLLGVTITAEGIETACEASALTNLGSDTLQGFYFSKPQPPARLTEGLATASTDHRPVAHQDRP